MPEGTSPGRGMFWTTADNKRIEVCNLGDDHLRNILFFLQRTYASDLRVAGDPSSVIGLVWNVLTAEADFRKLPWTPRGVPQRPAASTTVGRMLADPTTGRRLFEWSDNI